MTRVWHGLLCRFVLGGSESQRQGDWGVGEQARVVVAQSAGDVAAAAAAVGGQVSGDLTVRGHGLAAAEVKTGTAGLEISRCW